MENIQVGCTANDEPLEAFPITGKQMATCSMEDFVCLSSQILYLDWRYTQLGRSYWNAIQRNNALVGVFKWQSYVLPLICEQEHTAAGPLCEPCYLKNSSLLRNWSFALKPAIQCKSFQLERPWMIGSSTWISLQMLWRHNVHVRSFCFAKLSSWGCKCPWTQSCTVLLDCPAHNKPALRAEREWKPKAWKHLVRCFWYVNGS